MAKAAPKRRVMKVTETEIDTEAEATEVASWDEAPLFDSSGTRKMRIDSVSVRRTDPPSGYLGTMPPDVSEARLAKKWGGGTYVLEGKNADTHLVAKAHRRLQIAGDPIFSSEVEEHEYRKSNGLPDRARGVDGAISTKDLLQAIEEKDEKRRLEQIAREDRLRAEVAAREERDRVQLAEREERERKVREERAALQQRDADERKAREQKDADEREDRRRREAREDDERRSRMHREDMERMTAQNAQALANSQQFFTQLATTLKSDEKTTHSDPVKTLLAGMQIAREMVGAAGGAGGEGASPPNFLTGLITRLPEILQEVRTTAMGVKAEMSGGGAAAATGDRLEIKGPLATKAKHVIAQLQRAGKNPEAELGKLLTFASGAIEATPPKSTKAAPAQARAAKVAAAPRVVRPRRARTPPSPPRRKAPRKRGAA